MAGVSAEPRFWLRRIRRVWLWVLLPTVAAFAVLVFVAAAMVPLSSDTLRSRLVAALSDRLNGEVSIDDLRVRVFPRFHAEGVGLTVRRARGEDVPPLFKVNSLTVEADLIGLVRKHVAQVTLRGL